MPKSRATRAPITLPVTPGRRTVVLLADLEVEGLSRALTAGRVVEAAEARFDELDKDAFRDATPTDITVAGLVVQLDLPEEPAEAADEEPASPAPLTGAVEGDAAGDPPSPGDA